MIDKDKQEVRAVLEMTAEVLGKLAVKIKEQDKKIVELDNTLKALEQYVEINIEGKGSKTYIG